LSGRRRAATAFFEFAPGRFHRRDQFLTPMFRQPVLENFHERDTALGKMERQRPEFVV